MPTPVHVTSQDNRLTLETKASDSRHVYHFLLTSPDRCQPGGLWLSGKGPLPLQGLCYSSLLFFLLEGSWQRLSISKPAWGHSLGMAETLPSCCFRVGCGLSELPEAFDIIKSKRFSNRALWRPVGRGWGMERGLKDHGKEVRRVGSPWGTQRSITVSTQSKLTSICIRQA